MPHTARHFKGDVTLSPPMRQLVFQMGRHGVALVLGLDQFLEDQLVDAAVVHVHDLHFESPDLQDFALVGDARDLMQDQAGHGVEAFVFAEVLA